ARPRPQRRPARQLSPAARAHAGCRGLLAGRPRTGSRPPNLMFNQWLPAKATHSSAASREARLATMPVTSSAHASVPPLPPDRESAGNAVDAAAIISSAGNGNARKDGLNWRYGLPGAPIPLSRQPRRTRKSRTELGSLGLIGDEAFLVGLFPLPAQRVGSRGDPGVGVLRVGDVCGLGAFQEPDVLPAGACRGEERSAWLPGEQPVLVAAVQRVDHCDPVRWHRGALGAATVGVRWDDEQVTLRLETGMDWDLQ